MNSAPALSCFTTRNDSPNFHARLKIDGISGYIVKSTKRKSLGEAARIAEELLDCQFALNRDPGFAVNSDPVALV